MELDRRQRISRLYHEALERPHDERHAFLDTCCQGDEKLREEVAALLAPQSGLQPGAKVGTFHIERLLGRGGMGEVFLAHDAILRRRVALKVVGSPADTAARAKLLREARNAAALNHPNICTVHEVGEADGHAFIAMEYVDGVPLSDRLAESALSPGEAVQYGIEAADALAYAHDHGVIHRDLKAANAIVTKAGRLKLVDFGLARREDPMLPDVTTMASVTEVGVAAGTPYSMAPEQVRGDVTDARTDIWALGVLLYEMVSGTKPFTLSTVPELFSSILRDAPTALPNTVPAAARLVIEQCLEKRPERRYQRADEVRAALEAIQAGTTPLRATWRAWIRRRPWVAAAVSALALVGVLVGGNVGRVREKLIGNTSAAGPIKLAVLPFENLTGDPEQEYFSDGLTDEMITQLGRLHPERLSVIARTSSMRYKKREASIDQIGRELGVDYVMEGSARREGNRVRISATLIGVRDQTQRWTDSFEREVSGILALQADVARGVAGSLALTLLPEEQARLAKAHPVNAEAYEAYLKGVSYETQLNQAGLDRAMAYYELALQRDPNYALAYTGIYSVWSARQQMGFVAPRDAAPRLKAAVAKALELDGTLPEAHFRLASQYAWTDWNWSAAEPEFRRAIALNPNYAEAHAFYSHYLSVLRRPDEAMAQIELAVQLDPFSDLIQSLYGVILQRSGRFNDAIAQFRNALRTAPGSPLALNGLARSLEAAGMYEEAFAAEKAIRAARGDLATIEALDRGYAKGGYRTALLSAANTLAARPGGLAPVNTALLYLRAGENERGLNWLERAYEYRDPNLPYANSGPFYENIRRDPRFQALLQRMNLPE